MKLHHIGIVVRNIDNSIKYYSAFDKISFISEKFFDQTQKVNVIFIEYENKDMPSLELIESVGNNSKVSLFLKKYNGGLHHLCYEVEDLNDSIKKLKEHQYTFLSLPEKAVAFENRRIVFCFGRDHYLIELLERGNENEENEK